MKTQLDMDKIAKGLGTERRGQITSTGTGPRWTERRLLPLAPQTLKRLEELTAKVRKHGGGNVEPMQLAALLLDKTTKQLSENEAEAEALLRSRRRANR
jgi:hypothetical protein